MNVDYEKVKAFAEEKRKEAGKVRPVECSTQQKPCNHYELNQGPLCIHCGHVSTCHDVVADYEASERRANTFKQLADGTSVALEKAQARIAALEQQLAKVEEENSRALQYMIHQSKFINKQAQELWDMDAKLAELGKENTRLERQWKNRNRNYGGCGL